MNTNKIFPPKLKSGDEVRVIAPSRSLAIIGAQSREVADRRFAEMGLKLSFGAHVDERNEFDSSSIESRVSDLHAAFADPAVKAILTSIGGFNSNQLLRYMDWDLIRNNPKIFCGFSDITALNNSFYAKTGLVSYYGPHYSTFGQELYFDYTLEYFKKCLFDDTSFAIVPSAQWSDDMWYMDQQDRHLMQNAGYLVINEGTASGAIIGGNHCTLNLLQGTEYMPSLHDSVLFIEDDEEARPRTFDRDLQSLIHLPEFAGVKGIVIGRFQKASGMTDDIVTKIIKTKKELDHIPVITGVDFGHTDPKVTLPIGGEVEIQVKREDSHIKILKH